MNAPHPTAYLYFSLQEAGGNQVVGALDAVIAYLGFGESCLFLSANPDLRNTPIGRKCLMDELVASLSRSQHYSWFCLDDEWERFSRMWHFEMGFSKKAGAVFLKMEPRVDSAGFSRSGGLPWGDVLAGMLDAGVISLYESPVTGGFFSSIKIEIRGVVRWVVLHLSNIFDLGVTLGELRKHSDKRIAVCAMRGREAFAFIEAERKASEVNPQANQ